MTHPVLSGSGNVQDEVAAAAGARQLPAQGAVPERDLVQLVRGGAPGHLRIHHLLVHEPLVQASPEAVQVLVQQRFLHPFDVRLNAVHAVHRLLAAALQELELPVDQSQVGPYLADVAEQQVRLQVPQQVAVQVQRNHRHAAGAERDVVEAAERSGILVLLAARDLELDALDPVVQLRHLGAGQPGVGVRRQGADQRGRHCRRTAEAAPGRGVRANIEVEAPADLELRRGGLRQVQHAVVHRFFVQPVVDRPAQVQRPNTDARIAARMQGDVRAAVDGGREHGAAVPLVPVGQVGAAARKADPQRRPGPDPPVSHAYAIVFSFQGFFCNSTIQ